jgi:acylphosphatase
MKRELVSFHGRVQGVGFREHALAVARSFAVAGTVRNRRLSNVVEIDVEGEPEAVDAFIAEVVARRPVFARIDGVVRLPLKPRGSTGFARAPTE